MVQIPILLAYAAITTILLFSLFRFFRREKLRAVPVPTEHWRELSAGFFERNEKDPIGKRLDLALRSGMRRLGLNHGIVTLQRGETCVVVKLSSEAYAQPRHIQVGAEIPRRLLFCGELRESRETLAIDLASLTDWRAHWAHRELGWETYIGTRIALKGGEALTVGFFQNSSRDHLFNSVEKDFVQQMTKWIAAMLQREQVGESLYFDYQQTGEQKVRLEG